MRAVYHRVHILAYKSLNANLQWEVDLMGRISQKSAARQSFFDFLGCKFAQLNG